MKTEQIVFTKVNQAELIEADYHAPQKDEVTVRLAYSAISSGTERANITGLRYGPVMDENSKAVFPRYAGYSAAGIITDIGGSVDDLKKGDRVIVYWGSHKKDITIGRDHVIKIPDAVPLQQAAMAFIATFPLAAIRKTKLEIGESAMVMGLGILGQFAVQELRAAGAMPIIAVDPVAERRELALKMGADIALDPTRTEFCNEVKECTGGGVNIAIEVTGLGQGLIQALDCMKKFGRIALLGCTRSSDFHIDYYRKVHMPGITIVGAHTNARMGASYPGCWTHEDDIKAILRLLEGGRLDFEGMICEVCRPEDAPDVYSRLIHDRNFPVGVLFDWTGAKNII